MFLSPYYLRGMAIMSLVTVVACAKPAVISAPPSPLASVQPLAVPRVDVSVPAVITDPSVIISVQRILISLGYDVGRPDGVVGVATRRAILAFQKDQSMLQDGLITAMLVEKLKVFQGTLARRTTIALAAGDTLYYSNGSSEVIKDERMIQWDQRFGKNFLVAVRPSTSLWPSAARAGLDWATSHALDQNNGAPTMWTSTGVDQRFEIRTFALASQEEILIGEKGFLCRRFELRSSTSQRSYPGVACADKNGNWHIARTKIQIARPAGKVGRDSAVSSIKKPRP